MEGGKIILDETIGLGFQINVGDILEQFACQFTPEQMVAFVIELDKRMECWDTVESLYKYFKEEYVRRVI